MSFTEVFIRRPVATILLSLGILGAGCAAYTQLPVAALPQTDFPTISVSAQLAGASPSTMASSVATPLIKQFETISGIDTITASSSLGSTSITLQFALSRNIDAAAADVQAAIARTAHRLPSNMTSTPSYRKQNPAAASILLLGLTSDTLAPTQLDDIAENILTPALSTISGVAQAIVYGAQTYAVRAEVDPAKLDSRGLALSDVASAMSAANDQTPTGTVQNNTQALTLSMDTQRTDAAEFRSLVIARPDGHDVRLGDIATVSDSTDNINQHTEINGQPAIVLAVQRQPDANTVAVVDAIRAKIPEIEASLPRGVHIQSLNDSSTSIRGAVADVQRTLSITVGLVVLVIFLFLRSVPATLIPALAVPMSLIAAVAGMYALGFSIDNISLLGMTLAVGLVVDDAIVMLELIVRKGEEGMKPFEAAIEGSREITPTIISMSLSLVAVFLPILLMGGVVGRVLNEFGVVVTMAILASAVVSLTVTPMLAARLPQARKHHGEADQGRITRGYGHAVAWSLRHRYLMLVVLVLTFGASAWAYSILPRSFFPTEDTGILRVFVQARQDISYPAMRTLQTEAARIVQKNASVADTTSILGGGRSSFNSGFMLVQLKPREDRPPLDQTVASLRKELAVIPGLHSFVSPQQNLRFGGRSSNSQYQLVLQSLDAGQADDWSGKLMDAMTADTATFTDVSSDLENSALQANIDVNYDRAAALGISTKDLRNTLEAAFGSLVVTQIQSTGNSYDVYLEYNTALNWDEGMLSEVNVPSSSGTLVPLLSFATVTRGKGPVAVNQTGQLASVTLSFDLPEGVALSEATARVRSLAAGIGLPQSVTLDFAGSAQLLQQSTGNMAILIGAAILTIYVVLGVLYESFIHPLTILSGLPSAAFGALLTLRVFGFDLSIIAMIGLLILIGIVKKNAIMMVEVALTDMRETSCDPVSAMQRAAVVRFRPIMMTTFCALLAAVPIAMGTGVGSELRQPLGVAVVGGLLVSQTLTLLITPAIFVELERLSAFLRRIVRPKGKTAASVGDASASPVRS